MTKLPYFDFLLGALKKGNQTIEESFGRHVHWGYWHNPDNKIPSNSEFSLAAENLSKLIYSAAKIKNSQDILDVGCGFGGTIASLNENHQQMNLVGLNIDERQLARAREQVIAAKNNTIRFQQGDACKLPFADNSFDVVLAVECIFHFSSREQFFKEAYRVLKPNGYLALSDFILKKPSIMSHGHIKNPLFGTCNIEFSPIKYQQLAKKVSFTSEISNNISKNTLPTYRYIKSLIKGNNMSLINYFAAMITLTSLQLLSQIGVFKYHIFTFKKM